MRIRKPTADWYGMLRVEYVGSRRVVDDDGVLQVAAHLGQVLDIVTTMVVTALSKQPMVNDTMDIQLVQKRITVL